MCFTAFTLLLGNLSAYLWIFKEENLAYFLVMNSWNTFPWVSPTAADKPANISSLVSWNLSQHNNAFYVKRANHYYDAKNKL